MVVPAHSLVAPGGANGSSMVSSLLKEHFNVFSFLTVFFLGSVRNMDKECTFNQRNKTYLVHLNKRRTR